MIKARNTSMSRKRRVIQIMKIKEIIKKQLLQAVKVKPDIKGDVIILLKHL